MSVEPGGLVTSAKEEPTKRKDFCQLWTEKVKNAASIGKVLCPIFKGCCRFKTDSRYSRKVMRFISKSKAISNEPSTYVGPNAKLGMCRGA